jgi:Annexin
VRDIQDILIDIYVGRSPQDLRLLADGFTRLNSSISTIVNSAESAELQTALGIVSELNRPDTTIPIDAARVYSDVEILISTMSASFPNSSTLFDILLRRSDTHIQQMALHYQMKTGQPLDKDIRKNVNISNMANKIAVHAVRTATNITYRDCMLLRDALGHNAMLGGVSKKKLAIRVCRMHKFKQHWLQIKAEYCGVTGKQFVDKVRNSQSGVFGDLMTAMAMV